jgi:8-oxo-dGTP pyrophosphatase MutT (NUDIX family)
MTSPHRPTQRIDGQIVLENRYFRVHEDRVRFHAGREATHWKIDYHRVGVGVLPILADGRALLGLHYRYCPGTWGWEIAAGGAEPDEDFGATARRELFEETGCESPNLQLLLDYHPAPGLGNERFLSFVATDLQQADSHPDVEEIYELRPFTWEEIEVAVEKREIVCGFTLTTLFAARARRLI